MQLIGAMFRRNTSGQALKFDSYTIPKDAFVIHHINDSDFDGTVYINPDSFDPSRFAPGRYGTAEDRKRYAFMGYGAAVHPCGELMPISCLQLFLTNSAAGARLARLQSVIATSIFLALFDFDVLDDRGRILDEPPRPERNNHKTSIPKGTFHIRYRLRSGVEAENLTAGG